MISPAGFAMAGEHIAKFATGASSRAIAAHLAGVGDPRGDYPMDAADFGRCETLLTECPSLRDSFARMAEVNDYWAALVPAWESIRTAEDQTAAIKAIIVPIEDADPAIIRLGDNMRMRVGKEPLRGKEPQKMKETAADRDVRNNAYRVTAAELRQFIERWERLDAEKKDIADQQKEVMAEAKGRGYDTKIIRQVIALRKRDKDDIAEEEAVLEMYKEALGMV